MTDEAQPLSMAMKSALQAVARMKGDSVVVWSIVPAVAERDDRFAPDKEAEPYQ